MKLWHCDRDTMKMQSTTFGMQLSRLLYLNHVESTQNKIHAPLHNMASLLNSNQIPTWISLKKRGKIAVHLFYILPSRACSIINLTKVKYISVLSAIISNKPNQHPKQRLVSFSDFRFIYAASAGPLVADLSSSYRLSEHRGQRGNVKTKQLSRSPPFHVATGNSKERKGAFSPRFMFQKKKNM